MGVCGVGFCIVYIDCYVRLRFCGCTALLDFGVSVDQSIGYWLTGTFLGKGGGCA